MKKIKNINASYAETNSGSIDYQYYDQRARNIRSESVWKLLKGYFSDKKNSPKNESEECDVMIFNRIDKHQNQFNSLKEAA